jgi:hypothetical protein
MVGLSDTGCRISIMRSCRDCDRPLRDEPALTESPLVDACVRVSARVCLWCYDLNLLSGGFEPAGLEERWTKDELVALYRAAMDRKATKQLHWRIRMQEKERKKREEEENLGVMF